MSSTNVTEPQSRVKIHPDYLVHATQSFLPVQQQAAFINACNRPLRTSIRLNRLKINHQQFADIATRYAWQLTAIPWCPDGYWIETSPDSEFADISLGNLAEHVQGLFYIQEASSMLPPYALLSEWASSSSQVNNKDELLVMDMAAAPGSKTTQLAAMLDNRGIILANELSASRLKSLHSNLLRCGVLNTCLSHLDGSNLGEWMPEQFDYILLDAPCGGEGTVRKDPLALQNWSLVAVNEIARLQKKLILSAYQALKPGGRLVYSTCTLSLEENHQVADYLVEQTDAEIKSLENLFEGANKAITTNGYLHILPQLFDSEGFFVASFQKPRHSEDRKPLKVKYDSPFQPLLPKIKHQVLSYYKKHFSIDLQLDGYQLLQRDKEIWMFPARIELINQYLKVNRAGMQIAQVYPNKIRSTHDMAICLGDLAGSQKVILDSSQASAFIQGLNIQIEPTGISDGEVLLEYQGHVLGIGQNQRGKVKNGLARDLVRDNLTFR